jgi:hypothetical protein
MGGEYSMNGGMHIGYLDCLAQDRNSWTALLNSVLNLWVP